MAEDQLDGNIVVAVRAFVRPPKKCKMTPEEALAKVKQFVKVGGDMAATEVLHYLQHELIPTEISTKLKCLHVIDLLFHRSKAFRHSVAQQLQKLFSHFLIELDHEHQIIGSEQQKDQLRDKCLETLEIWDIRYGIHLPPIRALSRYLKEAKGVVMPDIQSQIREMEQHRTEQAQHLERLLETRTRNVIREMGEDRQSIADNLNIVDESLNILFPLLCARDTGEDEDIAWERAEPGAEHSESVYPSLDEPAHRPGDDDEFTIYDTMALMGLNNMNFVLSISLSGAAPAGNAASGSDEATDGDVGIVSSLAAQSQTNEDLFANLKDALRVLRQHHVRKIAAWRAPLAQYCTQPTRDAGELNALMDNARDCLRWIDATAARIADVEIRCADINHSRTQMRTAGSKRAAEQATSQNDEELGDFRTTKKTRSVES